MTRKFCLTLALVGLVCLVSGCALKFKGFGKTTGPRKVELGFRLDNTFIIETSGDGENLEELSTSIDVADAILSPAPSAGGQ